MIENKAFRKSQMEPLPQEKAQRQCNSLSDFAITKADEMAFSSDIRQAIFRRFDCARQTERSFA